MTEAADCRGGGVPAPAELPVPTAVRRLDLLAATARLLLEGVGLNESVLSNVAPGCCQATWPPGPS